MAIQPTHPQGIGGVLDTTFQLYKASVAVVWPICLLQSVAGSPPSIYMLLVGGGAGPEAMAAMMTNPIYWLINLVSLVAAMWVIGGLYLKEYSIGIGQEQSIGAALGGSAKRLVPLVLMVLLFILALAVGLVLLIIPFFILTVSLMLSTSLVLFENKGPVEALTGSHKLVWGNWWRTAAVLTVGFIIVMVIYFAVALVVGVVTPLLGLGFDNLFVYSLLGGMLVGVFMNLLVAPFGAAMLIALYWDLKLRREGGDLAARVGALNAA